MSISEFLQKIIDWLRKGYPEGVPEHDYIPLFALLHREGLSEDDLSTVANDVPLKPPDAEETDGPWTVTVTLTKVTSSPPSEDEIKRVVEHLRTHGWPFDDVPG